MNILFSDRILQNMKWILISIFIFSCTKMDRSVEENIPKNELFEDSSNHSQSMDGIEMVKSDFLITISFNIDPQILIKLYSFGNGYLDYRRLEIYSSEGKMLQEIDSINGNIGDVFLEEQAFLTPKALYIYDKNKDGFLDLIFTDDCAILDNCNSSVYLYNNIAKVFQGDDDLSSLNYDIEKDEYYSLKKDQRGIGYTYIIYKKTNGKIQEVYVENRELIEYDEAEPEKSKVSISVDIADSKGRLVLYRELEGTLDNEEFVDPVIGERRF